MPHPEVADREAKKPVAVLAAWEVDAHRASQAELLMGGAESGWERDHGRIEA